MPRWFNRFKNGWTSVESDERPGRPQTARNAAVVERVRNLILEDHRLTLRVIAADIGISKDSAHAILRVDLNIRIVVSKFLTKLMSAEQRLQH
ncbi:hypothetical protein C0J52_04225 [Blattella germanica]|nr:hypothetical protein C0J52_04225 [Blattella germanica]